MIIKKYEYKSYSIHPDQEGIKWFWVIFREDYKPDLYNSDTYWLESDEWYETEEEAEKAVKYFIDLAPWEQ